MSDEPETKVDNNDIHPDNHPDIIPHDQNDDPEEVDRMLEQFITNLLATGGTVPEMNGIPPEQLIEMYGPKSALNTPDENQTEKDPTP